MTANEVLCGWHAAGWSISLFRQITQSKLSADVLPLVDSTVCPAKALLAGQNSEIMRFVRPERNPPDEQR